MATRWARFTRGWLAALFATLVAAGSHTAAGGAGVHPVSLLLALTFAGLACIALTGRSLSLVRLTLAVGASQLAFHTVFATMGTTSGATGVVTPAGHGHEASAILLDAGSTATAHHTSGWMWAAHVAAAVATIIALRCGEAAFWRLRGIALLALGLAIAGMPVPHAPGRSPALPVVGEHLVVRTLLFLRTSLGLRGPPVATVA
jgi:hypothetical protein